MSGSAYLDDLNSAQRAAVDYGIGGDRTSPPLLIIAGAGTGKTNTLAHRVAHLVINGADPHRILLMTFSRRAAAEMTNRVERIARRAMGDRAAAVAGLAWAGTFHAMGARLLREYASDVGLNPNFTIHDREDSADLMNLVRHELGFSSTELRFPAKGACLAIYSRCVNSETSIERVLASAFPWCASWSAELKSLFASYVEAKQRQNVLDYDDLLLCWAQAMSDATLAEDIAGRFDHVLVDEYQDTNRLQASILLALKPDGCGVTVVGDDAQSIYSFRSAEVKNMLEFPQAFTPAAKIMTLERNYRSTPAILDAANAVIAESREGFRKKLWSERPDSGRPRLVAVRDESDQARYVADQILEARENGLKLKEQSVLFRASYHSGPLEVELTRRNVPFKKFGGLKFLDSAHVKDLLAMLRFAENPRDRVAGFRILLLMQGVGPSAAQRVLDHLSLAPDPCAAMSSAPSPPRAADAWPTFIDAMSRLHAGRAAWPAQIEIARLWYEPNLERMFDDAAARRADLMQLQQIAAGYPSREKFLTELTLDPPDATSGHAAPPHLDEDYLILSTIHSAKGQEWKSVFVLSAVDGCIPSDLSAGEAAELEEERRLLYVAMTRARDDLRIVLPQRYFVHGQQAFGDRHVYAARTRFIPDRLLKFFEQTTWPTASHRSAARRPDQGARIDVSARMRAMWR